MVWQFGTFWFGEGEKNIIKPKMTDKMKKKNVIVPIQKKCSHIKVKNSNKNAKINNHHETDSVNSERKTHL